MNDMIESALRDFFRKLDPNGLSDVDEAVKTAANYLNQASVLIAKGSHQHLSRYPGDLALHIEPRVMVYFAKSVFDAFRHVARDYLHQVARTLMDEALAKDAAAGILPTYRGVPVAPWQFEAFMKAADLVPATKPEIPPMKHKDIQA